jgi:hypothetical protein
MKNRFLTTFFFGNYFYGFCTVALSVEAMLQQQYPLNGLSYFIFIFALTLFYYTLSYSVESIKSGSNPRTLWYAANHNGVKLSQGLAIIVCLFFGFYFLRYHEKNLVKLSVGDWVLVLIFPGVAFLYYGITYQFRKYSLRNIGWMKPFVIGFVWAGFVTIYPIVYYQIVNDRTLEITWVEIFLFVKNFMFITVLAIMFDIKDYATDSNMKLKTYVVEHGLRTTIFKILIPLSVAGLGSFLVYGFMRHFSEMRIFMNTIPFLMMITFAYYLHRRQSIFYYLVLIDGLMLVKALCGSIAVTYF